MDIDVEKILENLSYCFSTPEADTFFDLVFNKKYAEAQKMLPDYLTEVEAQALIDYLSNRYHQKIKLEEIEVKDIPLKESDNKYLFKIGVYLNQSDIRKKGNEWVFYANNNFFPIHKAIQVWKIIPEA